MYQYVLAIHIIFVVCWMAGLFYMVRLFIYHTEAQDKPEPARTILSDQFTVMEKKLWWIITTPSMYLVVIAGATMLHLNPGLWKMPWLHVKLLFVVVLITYHFICQHKMKQMANGVFKWTSTQLRLWNELATVLLFAIVFLVVLKSAVNWIFGVIGIILFSLILMSAVKVYKYFREKKGNLKQKVSDIERKIEQNVKPYCSEEFWVTHYGAFDIDPKYLVYWICVKTDSAKKQLKEDPDLGQKLHMLLVKNNYPKEAIEQVFIGFESQETVDRESNGNWWHHWK